MVATGSDCADCGVRIFCVSCPAACQARNLQLFATLGSVAGAKVATEQFCLESAWNNGNCEPGCNNLECGYNECTSTQIVAACVPKQELARVDYSTPPSDGTSPSTFTGGVSSSVLSTAQLTPVSLQLELDPARLSVDEGVNEVVLFQVLEYTLQWVLLLCWGIGTLAYPSPGLP